MRIIVIEKRKYGNSKQYDSDDNSKVKKYKIIVIIINKTITIT